MATFEDGGQKSQRVTITSQLNATEDEVRRQGARIADLEEQVKELYSALGVPIPPAPDRVDIPLRRAF